MLKEGSARSHDCQIWRILCPWVSTPLLYMLIPWTFELVSLIFQYLLLLLLFFFFINIYLFGCLGFQLQDLSLWRTDFSVVAHSLQGVWT